MILLISSSLSFILKDNVKLVEIIHGENSVWCDRSELAAMLGSIMAWYPVGWGDLLPRLSGVSVREVCCRLALTRGAETLNTLMPRQNGRQFPDEILKFSLNENVWISIKISLIFVPKVPINSIPALVLIMAWRRPGDKPLSETMMVSVLTHICITPPQSVNTFKL